MADSMPATSDIVIIGGGVAGLSTAMQLASRGASVTLLEREQLGNGSTGRAAGLLGQLRGTPAATRMLMDGVQVVAQLEERTGVEIFVQTGSLRVAETAERAREIRDLVDAPLQTAALGHVYLTTRPDDRHPVDRLSPAIRDRHLRLYSRPESGGLIVGRYGSEVVQHDMGSLPDDFDMSALSVRPDDLHVALLIDATKKRFPWIDERTPMTITRGIMTFTPDGKPLCGKRTDIDGLFHCSGFCGHGIVQSPVIGVIMADLVLDGHTDYDIEAIHADRFFEHPELQTRPDIEAACGQMQSAYYGRIEDGGGNSSDETSEGEPTT